MRGKIKSNRGFSLVELIVVIAIMAILAGALAPALIKYIDKARKTRLEENVKTIYTNVNLAMVNFMEKENVSPINYVYDKNGTTFHDPTDNTTVGRLSSYTMAQIADGNIDWENSSDPSDMLGKYLTDNVYDLYSWAKDVPSGKTVAACNSQDSDKYFMIIVYDSSGIKRIEVSQGKYITVYDGTTFDTKKAGEAGASFSNVN